MAKADNIRSHDGAKHLGRDGGAKRGNTNALPSGKGGKVGTAAGVQAFNGRGSGPGKPPKLSSGERPSGPDSPRGRDAGGRENMEADGRKLRGAGMSAPESGSAKARPSGVHACDGTYAPKGVARKPAAKTKD